MDAAVVGHKSTNLHVKQLAQVHESMEIGQSLVVGLRPVLEQELPEQFCAGRHSNTAEGKRWAGGVGGSQAQGRGALHEPADCGSP